MSENELNNEEKLSEANERALREFKGDLDREESRSSQMNEEEIEEATSGDYKIKPEKPFMKKLIVWLCILAGVFIIAAVTVRVIFPSLVGAAMSSASDDKGMNQKGDGTKLAEVNYEGGEFKAPPKPKLKPAPQKEEKPQINPLFAEGMPQDDANKTRKKRGYVVLKASRGAMVNTKHNKAQVKADEKRAEAEKKKAEEELEKKQKKAEEEREARLYPYGFYYRTVNGKIIKVPKTAAMAAPGYGAYRDTSSALGSTIFQPKAEAYSLNLDKNFLLQKGTFIPCSLDNRIISDLAGGVNCTVSDDVYSENGNVVLIEKGSKVFGYYEQGQIKIGMDRIFVIWQEIRTPDGVVVPVDSGSTSPLGDTGTAGYIDYHWALRFTSALLVSIFDDAFSSLVDNQKDNKTYVTDNTQQTVDNMATETLKRFIDIEPTLYKNQGSQAGIYVNKDIDFSKIYELELSK